MGNLINIKEGPPEEETITKINKMKIKNIMKEIQIGKIKINTIQLKKIEKIRVI